ncbi:hypothetical protein [Silvania hatchlandensis]|uniref:Uncharacterized protein n=1 Tax=Silvania hatchlandensis TaxID=2926469 RepID=A0A9J6Q3K8_9ENTR|nr:hypothetical protein [Silvania hatchlandensis]MCU6665593.1 hypothetical protein [Silvania hatchlandensis]
MRHIKITPYGNIGNQLFQYMLALAIKFRTGVPVLITGLDIPSFGIKSTKVRDEALCLDIKNHTPPLDAIVELVKDVKNIDVNIKCLSTRMCYYSRHLTEFRRYLKLKKNNHYGYNEHYLVINVRGAEISKGVHRNYIPIPLSFYANIIEETGLKPVFVGQLGDDKYSTRLRDKFPNALFPKFNSWEDDFNVICSSVNVIPAISTFSWLATWLSESAKNIYFPIMGLYHPIARPDIDMLPVEDDRYHFYLSDLLEWGNPEETIDSLINDSIVFEKLEGTALLNRLPLTTSTEGLDLDAPRISIE